MLRLSVIAFSALSISYACSPPVPPNLDPDKTAGPALDRQVKLNRESSSGFRPPQVLATLQEPAVNESSGIAASHLNPDLFWTHNDSGDDPFIYAFDREGKRRGVWRVSQAEARDWEDIAIGLGPHPSRGYIYVGDIGDNQKRRSEIIIYRVPEPTISARGVSYSKNNPGVTEPAEAIRLRYPDGKHDAETLLAHPKTGDLYILTKNFGSASGIYKVPARPGAGINTLIRVGQISLPSPLGGVITGGDISPDGAHIVLCDYFAGYELVLPGNSTDFDVIWKQPIAKFDLGSRRQGEAICYSLDGNSVLATSEGLPCPLIEVRRSEKND